MTRLALVLPFWLLGCPPSSPPDVKDTGEPCVPTTWYLDQDGDGHGGPTSTMACAAPADHTGTSDDCDDTDPQVHPGAGEVCDGRDQDCDGAVDEDAVDPSTWFADADGDGFGDPSSAEVACAAPSGWTADATDCDDADPLKHPGAPEVCDGQDQDCDDLLDEEAVDVTAWHPDGDGDGWGDPTSSVMGCEAPSGWTADGADCDDADPLTWPEAPETCDGQDQDCDGTPDDDPVDGTPWYADSDGDGFGDPASPWVACAPPSGWLADATDCDGTDPAVHPGAAETCDGRDQDCDGAVDDSAADALSLFVDGDGDGSGDPLAPVTACPGPGHAAMGTDCDDADPTVAPGAAETCDGRDQDCDGATDEDAVDAGRLYADADGDGWGDPLVDRVSCPEDGWTGTGDDCDDANATVYPGAPETWYDGVDGDCGGGDDYDADGDGYQARGWGSDCDDTDAATWPGAPEVDWDGTDQSCNGLDGPSVLLGAASGRFLALEGYPATGSLVVPVANGAEGTLHWVADVSDPWITLSATSGTEGDSLTVGADALDLAEGTLAGTVTVRGDGEGAPSATLSVELDVVGTWEGTSLLTLQRDVAGRVSGLVGSDGDTLALERDGAGRLTGITGPAGLTVRYTRDALGRPTSIQDGDLSLSVEWTDGGHPREVTWPDGTAVGYDTWTASGLVGATYVSETRLAGYTYLSGLPWPDEVTLGESREPGLIYSFDADGRPVTREATDDGSLTTWTWDPETGSLSGLDFEGRAGTLQGAWTFDDQGRMASETWIGGSTSTATTYETDEAGRLVGWEVDGTWAGGILDEAGNRTSWTEGGVTTAYLYDSDNRLLQAGDTLFQYDAAGRLTARVTLEGTTRYTWDALGRLVEVDDGTQSVRYGWLPEGILVERTAEGSKEDSATSLVWDLSTSPPRPLQVTTLWGGSTRTVTWTWGHGPDVAEVDGGVRLLVADALGTVRAWAQGMLLTTRSYSPTGVPAERPDLGDPMEWFGWGGHFQDPNTGLVFLGSLPYDPELGRLLSPSPASPDVLRVHDLNRYLLCGGAPLDTVNLAGTGCTAPDLGHLPTRTEAGLDLLTRAAWSLGGAPEPVPTVDLGRDPTYGGLAQPGLQEGLPAEAGGGFLASDLAFAPAADHGSLLADMGLDRVLPSGAVPAEAPPVPVGAPDLSTVEDAADLLGAVRNASAHEPGATWTGDEDPVASLVTVEGMVVDERTGQLVLLGYADTTGESTLSQDDFMTALQWVHLTLDVGVELSPGVTIEDLVSPTEYAVEYFGGIEDTWMGWVSFDADRLLKCFGSGTDSLDPAVECSADAFGLPWFMTELETLVELYDGSVPPEGIRIWFEPTDVEYTPFEDDLEGFLYSDFGVVVQYEDLSGAGGRWDYADTYVAMLNEHFSSDLSPLFTSWSELGTMMRWAGVADWILDSDLGERVSWDVIDRYPIPWVETPDSTPLVEESATVVHEGRAVTLVYRGGVALTMAEEAATASPSGEATSTAGAVLAEKTADDILNMVPKEDKAIGDWAGAVVPFEARDRPGSVTFATVDLEVSAPGSAPVSLVRSWSSQRALAGDDEGMGPGWALAPVSARPSGTPLVYAVGRSWIPVPAYVEVTDHTTGRSSRFAPEASGVEAGRAVFFLASEDASGEWMTQDLSTYSLTWHRDDGLLATFDDEGHLLSLEGKDGRAVSYTWDGDRLTALGAGARSITLTWDDDCLAAATASDGRSTAYTCDGEGRLASYQDGSGNTWSYAWSDDLLAEGVGPDGEIFLSASWDRFGRVTAMDWNGQTWSSEPSLTDGSWNVTDGAGTRVRQGYDVQGRLTSLTDGEGGAWSFTWDDTGGLTQARDPLGQVTSWTWEDSLVASTTDPDGGVTRFWWDENGEGSMDLQALETADGAQYYVLNAGDARQVLHGELTFNDDGVLTGMLDPYVQLTSEWSEGELDVVQVDDLRWILEHEPTTAAVDAATLPGGGTWAITRGATGTPDASLSATGVEIQTTWDPQWPQVPATLAMGDTLRYAWTRDSRGRVVSIQDALGTTTTLGWEEDGLAAVSAPGGTLSLGRDGAGRVTSLTGPGGLAWALTWDGAGRLQSVAREVRLPAR